LLFGGIVMKSPIIASPCINEESPKKSSFTEEDFLKKLLFSPIFHPLIFVGLKTTEQLCAELLVIQAQEKLTRLF
jgi:hypothetical protein